MALMSFFKRPKHQRFQYHPRHYDPKKEDLEKRLQLARRAQEGDPDAIKERISTGFRKKYQARKGSGRTSMFRTNMLLLAIIVVLFGLTYVLLTVYLPRIIQLLE